MKRKSIVLLVCIIILICVAFAFCKPKREVAEDVILSLSVGSSDVEINGVKASIDKGPVIHNGHTLVPVRVVVEAFSGDVDYNRFNKAVTIEMDGNIAELNIDSTTAYINGKKKKLDTAPVLIDGRTMLSLSFIAEGFNLGVAWEQESGDITIVRDVLCENEYRFLVDNVGEYSGAAYVEINGNKPFFEDYEIIEGSFEYYSDIDELGRCDVAFASVGEDIMPTQKRGDISSVKPTGWHSVKYPVVDGGSLYNRCHLIGFQLTGENANRRNLITGTRYLNVDGMLPFENMVDDYVEDTGNNVMYRVTPLFIGDNLVAHGVLIEAYSVEDNGEGVSFCVYCYNVQPGVVIDYATGKSYSE